jgi:GNAT superfamily N-acetyltransferase
MPHAPSSLVEESNRLFQHTWTYFAKHLPGGGATRLPGLLIANGRSALPFMNVALVTAPLVDEADLAARIAEAASAFRRHELHWLFVVSDHFVPEGLRPRLTEACTAAGLQPMMRMYGMATEALTAPAAPPPALSFKVVETQALREAVGDINAAAYGMPTDICRAVTGIPDLWKDMLGVVGMLGTTPVASACVAAIDDIAYVALVATDPAHQRKGYADAVMRRALAEAKTEWGITRTVLHATPAGQPVYQRMGYENAVSFEAFTGA